MPAPTVFNQDVILDEAFRIARTEGAQRLSARRIAQNLGCSTQPIYSAFGSMQKLQDRVLQKAKSYVVEYLSREQQDEDPFFAMGMQYFRFSREERILFKWLFLERNMVLPFEKTRKLFAPLVDRIKLDDSVNELTEDQLRRIARDMMIYTHGLTSFMYDDNRPNAEAYVREQLMRMGKTVIEWEHGQKNIGNSQ
jgi:AcrR family transcriptional regulator